MVERLQRRHGHEQRAAARRPAKAKSTCARNEKTTRAAERDQRHVARVGLPEDRRRDACEPIDRTPMHEPRERQRHRRRAPAEPGESRQGDDRRARRGRARTCVQGTPRASASPPPVARPPAGVDRVATATHRRYTERALGGVVQLVRTPACHAGGRGFESRRSRIGGGSCRALPRSPGRRAERCHRCRAVSPVHAAAGSTLPPCTT